MTRLLRSGDEILADSDLYGGTCRLFTRVLERTGITARYADARDLDSFEAKITSRTKLIYVESPTNPLLRVLDLRRIAALAHAHGAFLCVDNSTMSPYLQTPLDLGADIVLHSATKFWAGTTTSPQALLSSKMRLLASNLDSCRTPTELRLDLLTASCFSEDSRR